MVACVYSAGAMQSPGSFLGGIAFFLPTIAFLIVEWVAWYRQKLNALLALAVICFLISGFAAFGVAANVAEAVQSGWPSGFGWFVAIGLAIASYFGACGCWRLRAYRASNHRLQLTGDARE